MKLLLYPETIVLCKLLDNAKPTVWAAEGNLHVDIHDPHGRSVICHENVANDHLSEIKDQSRWRFYQIDEIFGVDSIGVVSEFSTLLANEKISVFVISSYETDYLLVQPETISKATQVFESAGHRVSTL